MLVAGHVGDFAGRHLSLYTSVVPTAGYLAGPARLPV
jgi:hypothetical protein